MDPNAKFLVVFSVILWNSGVASALTYDVFHLRTDEIIRKYGYPAEVHVTKTEDDYYLKLHRIPRGKSTHSRNPIPVLILHGIFRSSDDMLGMRKHSLAFRLADAGYDVWLGNFRGNRYGNTHKYLSANDTKFWNFSFHEHGVYDLPALIDHVCNHTHHKKLLIITTSVASSILFVTASERPDYQNKIHGAVLLGPTVSFTGSFLDVFAPLTPFYEMFEKLMRHVKPLLNPVHLKNAGHIICTLPKVNQICRRYFHGMLGKDYDFDEDLVPEFSYRYYSSTPFKKLAHYGQLVNTGRFEKFDYGYLENWQKYQQSTPPEYNLRSVKIPLSVFIAPRDSSAAKKHLKYLLERLNTVKSIFLVPNRHFTHIDFVWSRMAEPLVFGEVLNQLEHLSKHGEKAESIKNFDNVYKQLYY